MKFEFENLHLVSYELGKSGVEIDADTLKKTVVSSFKLAWEWIVPKKERISKRAKIQIKILNQTDEENKIIAFYDFEISSVEKHEYYFSIYFDKILEAIKNGYFNPKWIETIWVHEIMHLLDSVELQEYKKDFEAFRKQKAINPVFDSEYNDGHWVLLSYLHSLRDEGLAVLAELLFNNRFRELLSEDEAYHKFNSDLTRIAEIAERIQYQTSNEKLLEYARFLNGDASMTVYTIAPWFLLNGLINSEPENQVYRKIKEALTNHEIINIDPEEVKLFIMNSRQFKFLDFLKSLPFKDLLYESFIKATSRFYDNQPAMMMIFERLRRIEATKDTHHYNSLMKETLGFPMEIEEISRYHSKFKSAGIPSSLKNDIHALYEIAIEGNITAIWALTYLYDDKDLIDDEINYLGFWDDYFMISTAAKIIN